MQTMPPYGPDIDVRRGAAAARSGGAQNMTMDTVTASDLRRLLAAANPDACLVLAEGRTQVVPAGDAPGMILIDRAQVEARLGPDPEESALVEYAALLDSEVRLQGG